MAQSKGEYANADKVPATAPAAAPALYVNYFEVGHNPFEFLMDLGQYHPGASEGDGRIAIHTRIAIAPPYAKMLSDLLSRAVQEHENQHGQIPLIGQQANPFDIVLSSLGDFEERARALRERERSDNPVPKSSRSRKGR
jgi:hypothetical protein